MKRTRGAAVLAGVTMLCFSAGAFSQASVDIGKREYENNCIACHGAAGKGDGPFVDLMYLKTTPPDITVLAKRNNGVFPATRVYQIIDGRQEVKAHGPRDMPIWGRDYLERAGDPFQVYPYDAEGIVRARILALVEYVSRLQAK